MPKSAARFDVVTLRGVTSGGASGEASRGVSARPFPFLSGIEGAFKWGRAASLDRAVCVFPPVTGRPPFAPAAVFALAAVSARPSVVFSFAAAFLVLLSAALARSLAIASSGLGVSTNLLGFGSGALAPALSRFARALSRLAATNAASGCPLAGANARSSTGAAARRRRLPRAEPRGVLASAGGRASIPASRASRALASPRSRSVR